MKVFNSDFVAIFRSCGQKARDETLSKCLKLCEDQSGMNFTPDELKVAKEKIRKLSSTFWSRWEAAKRIEGKFLSKNANWMRNEQEISISDRRDPTFLIESRPGPGRPSKPFAESSDRSRRRHKRPAVEALGTDASLALDVALTVARKGKNPELAKILKSIQDEPEKKKIRKLLESPPRPLSTTEALALFIDSNKTKAAYQKERIAAKAHGADIFPSYDRLLKEKKLCFPEGDKFSYFFVLKL